MLEEGIFFAPSQFEAAFLTLFHNDNETAKHWMPVKRCSKQ